MFVPNHEMLPDRFANDDVAYLAMTRFDVRMDAVAGAAAIGDRVAWRAHRVAAFRRWCLPSMLGQTPRPHAWILLFDEATTPDTAALIGELRDHGWIVPVLAGAAWNRAAVAAAKAVVRDRVGDAPYVACTRLDSDDSLHRLFHAAVDAALVERRIERRPIAPLCVNFPYGVYQLGGELLIAMREKTFFAVVESVDSLRGPYAFNHARVDEHMPVVNVGTQQPMYAYQRHDRNISGEPRGADARGEPIADPARVRSYFGLRP